MFGGSQRCNAGDAEGRMHSFAYAGSSMAPTLWRSLGLRVPKNTAFVSQPPSVSRTVPRIDFASPAACVFIAEWRGAQEARERTLPSVTCTVIRQLVPATTCDAKRVGCVRLLLLFACFVCWRA
jgi:hypothetical protein